MPDSAPFGRDALNAFLRRALLARREAILAHARPDGRLGTDPWIVRDQDGMLTLALLYLDADGPQHRDPALLSVIAAAGRYLRTRQDDKGMHPFDKKDGSNWGPIFMPWTYLRWIITYDLIHAELAPADLAVWREGLELGYGGIAATELSSASNIYPGPLTGRPPLAPGEVRPWIHNIPAHHAAGLFLAGRHFDRPDWQRQARDFMQLVVAEQSPHGWWTEHRGPVVLYNFVYLESLAVYLALSGDEAVRPALERGNRFHLHYLYPDGASIETVDERNPFPPLRIVETGDRAPRYAPAHVSVHAGMYATAEGRALLQRLIPHLLERDPATIEGAELLALFLPRAPDALDTSAAPERRFRMDGDALVAREDPWLVSLSAYCCPRTPNRFIQDRQNFVSIHHRAAGLILGGGNTKLQPRWSTLAVGDVDLLSPVGATRETPLAPDVAVAYTPDAAAIAEPAPNQWTLRLEAAGAAIAWSFRIESPERLHLSVRLLAPAPDGRAVTTHLTFIPYLRSDAAFSDGSRRSLGAEPWTVSGVSTLAHHTWRLSLPAAARIAWPVLPHNPYTANGHAEPPEGRLVVALALDAATPGHTLELTVPAAGS